MKIAILNSVHRVDSGSESSVQRHRSSSSVCPHFATHLAQVSIPSLPPIRPPCTHLNQFQNDDVTQWPHQYFSYCHHHCTAHPRASACTSQHTLHALVSIPFPPTHPPTLINSITPFQGAHIQTIGFILPPNTYHAFLPPLPTTHQV